MSDRTLPGVHDPEPEKRKNRGCLWLIVGFVALVALAIIIPTVTAKPYDPNNKYEAISQCEHAVKKRLKSPTTAEFDLTATGYGTWTVTGTVDAENSFGAKVRSDVQCSVIIEGDSARVRVDQLD